MGRKKHNWADEVLEQIGRKPASPANTAVGLESAQEEQEAELVPPEDGSFSAATDIMAIKEREVGCAEGEVKFTYFDACIGVAVRDNNKIRAVHLAAYKPDETLFNKDDAAKVIASLGSYTEAFILGQVSIWTNPDNGVSEAYNALESGVKAGAPGKGKFNVYTLGEGIYGAEINEDDMFLPT